MAANETVRSGRRIPSWASGLLARLSQDRPAVVTRDDLRRYLDELGMDRTVERTAQSLRELGWLASLHLKGVWTFVPAGEERPDDPYLELRAWRARDRDAVFALAGEAAAWHLGYIARAYRGTVALWVPREGGPPRGLRPFVSVIRLGWDASFARRLGPRPSFLRGRNLDLTEWASGLPAFGPEPLLVQLASRPASFRAWPDLIERLDQLVGDCDLERLDALIGTQSSSSRQRAAYLLHRGGRHDDALELRDRRPPGDLSVVGFGTGPSSVWAPDFHVNDRIVAPLQELLGKA